MNLEHTTLPLFAPRSTGWASASLDTNVLQVNNFYVVKRETNPSKKWDQVGMSLEHTTLPLRAPRSTDWASGPPDTNVLHTNNFDAVNVCKLLKKRN